VTSSIPDFDYARIPAGEVTLNVAAGGAGPPVVLLHGFPQTHLAWRHVAADLAADHRVICPDLRGYGGSDKPADTAEHRTYAKTTMAADVLALMDRLGHDRFTLVGHDRGAMVAFRTALDHPARVAGLAVLDVVPTSDFWRAVRGPAGAAYFHVFLMAHPAPVPERIIGADPDGYFGHFLDSWASGPATVPAVVRAAYLAAYRDPAAIAAVCADYRAGAVVDGPAEDAARGTGRRLEMPVTAIMQDAGAGPFDPAAVWRSWAPDLEVRSLGRGHLIPEEHPREVATAVRELIGRGSGRR
jgi:haloacetate dehalogenase